MEEIWGAVRAAVGGGGGALTMPNFQKIIIPFKDLRIKNFL